MKQVTDDLGQVFTSDKVARLMVNLAQAGVEKHFSILDPCIGKNVFLKNINNANVKNMVGIEVDKSLISRDISDFYSSSKREINIMNFFDFDLRNKFDIIIMNPPYVRQEKINGSINSKLKIKKHFNKYKITIPNKSNLYVYFFIKALNHLKKNGRLVAITYDSWLFTKFGKMLKEYLTQNYNVEKIIHFSRGAFDNVNIGATISVISNKKQQSMLEYFSFDSPNALDDNPSIDNLNCKKIEPKDFISSSWMKQSGFDLSSDFFIALSDISSKKINRGTNAIVNNFFIFDNERFKCNMTRVIKDVTRIKNFSVGEEWKYLLDINPDKLDMETEIYLKEIKDKVAKSPEKYKTLRQKINKNKYWYKVESKSSGNFIFNYYMRDNIDFIMNPNFIKTSDNFYNLYIEEHILENLCILNSTFTKYALLKHGRMQGNGLFKIQLYEFNNVPIMDINKLSESAKSNLRELGNMLLNSRRLKSSDIIEEIDDILISEYNALTDNNISKGRLLQSLKEIKGV